ncbi:MAG: FAD-dependent oxidoreductase [Bacteroidetes bacterium 24-39-8]|jgi:glycerol-3-phosphate dehydrogenase|nr:MAG: FAD-dependent oxidoreductase [Sphingobacteriia bacterium 35-40-8]OYZ47928.1 MAG: FAD-dependent oxidoreductase [Bacteroidetes bacterium 24-39-8]OZA67175.1 MAG: FAD-dependent oxidoreductase [Sphingobacteriia bacterium 39-39-8]HQR93807.1 glycerol-3-phosphate dehydrogenase/oxidase [Sediminibacterium sp.]HQS55878.1 glycerol-3-phosphate dehydrogenase/oxidase [Sediminibacterium sp.]
MKEANFDISGVNHLRVNCLNAIKKIDKVWDLVVIGGGATGLGIALDATSRGYCVLLVEQADFAKGTSSRSTKLVHGGVRYLANGELKLVREASIERGRLYQNAPHLVKDQLFIIPVYTLWERLKYTIGLKCYDWIAGKMRLGSSDFISKEETLALMPGIKQKNLVGGIRYHDGQFDDARLAINLAQTIWDHGGYAINYCSVINLLKNAKDQISGVTLKDLETGKTYPVQAKAIVNATGVFADNILQMDNPKSRKTLSVSQGVHLVLDKSFYSANDALMIPETSDGRVLFAVPWHGKVVVGTTDTPVKDASLEPIALEKEIDFILDTAGLYLNKKPKRSDVLSVFAGLRPLASPEQGKQKTKEISRGHKIIISPSGLFTIIGGKWTTYRKMGEDMVNRIEQKLNWHSKKSITKNLPIHGAALTRDWNDSMYVYGSDTNQLHVWMHKFGNSIISESLGIYEVQIVWALHHEMARTLEDILARRTRALFLDAKESILIARPVATIMAREMGNDEEWINNQVDAYVQLASKYIL